MHAYSRSQKAQGYQFYQCRWRPQGCTFTGRTFWDPTVGYSAVLLKGGHLLDKHALKQMSGMVHVYTNFIDLMFASIGGYGTAIRTVVLTEIDKPNGAFESFIQSKLKEAAAAAGPGPVIEDTVPRKGVIAALRANIPTARAIGR